MSAFKVLKDALLKLDRERHHLNFLTTCRDLGIIPKFLRTKSGFVSKFHARAKYNFELSCLKSVIRAKHALVDVISRRIYGIRNNGLYDNFARFAVGGVFYYSMMKINCFREEQDKRFIERHTKKLNDLSKNISNPIVSATNNRVAGFVNLSHHVFNEEQLAILNKGPKYVLPTKVPPINYIPQFEDVLKSVDPSKRDEVRHQIFFAYSRFLQSNKHFSSHEHHVIESIRTIPDLIFLPTDKSNRLAVLEKSSFLQKMHDVIQAIDCSRVSGNPLASLLNKTIRICKEFKTSEWQEDIRKLAKVNHLGMIPKMIAVIKDHKPTLPLRPIVVRCQSPTFYIEKVLVLILKDLLPISPHALKSTKDFIHRLESMQLPSNYLMFSLDVVSLYPSIDMNLALQNIQNQLNTVRSFSEHMKVTIVSAFNLIIKSNYFTFNKEIFFQNTGAPMGSPISGIAAEYILRPLEENFLDNAPIKPLCWFRFVDDVFGIWPSTPSDFNDFFNNLNLCDPRIKFTMELEKNNSIAYLDVFLTKQSNSIQRTVYRKPNNSNSTIPQESYTTISYKQAAYKSHIRRAYTICTPDCINNELDTIRKIALQNGFSITFINDIISNVSESIRHPPPQDSTAPTRRVSIQYTRGLHEKISRILRPHNIQVIAQTGHKLKDSLKTVLDPTPTTKLPGVYEIPILKPDQTRTFYIGQTMRKLEIRLKEHESDIKHAKQNTAISRTIYNNPGLRVLYNEAKIIAPFTTQSRTIIRESLEILKRKNNICNDQDSYAIPPIWLSII